MNKFVVTSLSLVVAWSLPSALAMGGSRPDTGGNQPLDPGEPAYCNPPAFAALRQSYSVGDLSNENLFQLGSVKVLGLGVGNSKVSATKASATSLARAGSGVTNERYCTFYFNDGNDDAADAFVWEYLSKPTGTDYAKLSREYMGKIGDIFDTRAQNFLACAERQSYIALGCDGMKHRGPTVFAMLLAYTGCNPKRAALIVNSVWGNNGIETSMREALAQQAFNLGKSHAAQSERLRTLFTTKR